jgi:hypothetical protein
MPYELIRIIRHVQYLRSALLPWERANLDTSNGFIFASDDIFLFCTKREQPVSDARNVLTLKYGKNV